MDGDNPGRVLVALGGNAIVGPDGAAAPRDQKKAIEAAMEQVAELVQQGWEVALTHGNGPQVGNLLRKNELTRTVVPPVPLDWCVAQTQATIGFLMVTALQRSLELRGLRRPAACLVTRVLVDADDPAWTRPAKPIGRIVDEAQARVEMAHGERWTSTARGWRRIVPSPEPIEILDVEVITQLVASGVVVIAAGGGGVPMVREADGTVRGVEAVLDKDLSGALLARAIDAECFVIATDVAGAATDFGTPAERWLGEVDAKSLSLLAQKGEFARGSMGPKVQATLRFLRAGGRLAAIAPLEHLAEAARGDAGTVIR